MPNTPSPPFPRRWAGPLAVVLLACLFQLLFFGMRLGLNLTLYALVAMLAAVGRYGWHHLSVSTRITFLGTALAGIMFFVYHSIIAGTMTVVGLILFAGLVHEPALRGVFHAALQTIAALVVAPLELRPGIAMLIGAPASGKPLRWRLRSALVPLLVTGFFVLLYQEGNPRFGTVMASVYDSLTSLIEELFTPRMLVFMLGLWISAVILRRMAPSFLVKWESTFTDTLQRVRSIRTPLFITRGGNPLERERQSGVVLLVMLNIVLLVVNLIDIHWIWFGFSMPEGFSLKQFVHEGTWMLIASIILGMLLLLHLFRGNLNFHPRNKMLKGLALVWVVQNFILGISVFLRNWHYISFHGLAYRRIGVIVFLLLVLVGLVTMFRKVRDRRSLFYLARVNGWAWFVVMVALTAVDWDSTIVRYNLRHDNPGEIDIDNYLAMSDKVLPLLYANLDQVREQMVRHRNNRVRWVTHLDPQRFREELDGKRIRFEKRVEAQRWPEFNLADRRTLAALEAGSWKTRP